MLAAYIIPDFTKKFCFGRNWVTLNMECGNIWHATVDGVLRQNDTPSWDIAAANMPKDIFTFHAVQTGHILPPNRNISEDITFIILSSPSRDFALRNGAAITFKEMII